MKLPNRNQILIIGGLLAAEGPDVAAVASWLSASGIPHLTGIVHLLGWLATALGGLALAWPRIRSALAAAGLATPPGAQAPWTPGKDTIQAQSQAIPLEVMNAAINAFHAELVKASADAGAVPIQSQSKTPATVPNRPRISVNDPTKR